MGAPIFMRCNRCGRLSYCRDGICDDCASYMGATGYRPSSTQRPDCKYCNGTGKVTHILGPATDCPYCRGTGKQ